jgi:hypothetical protein
MVQTVREINLFFKTSENISTHDQIEKEISWWRKILAPTPPHL